MSDFINRFFDDYGGQIGSRAEVRPQLNVGGINRTGLGDGVFHWPSDVNFTDAPLTPERSYTGHSGKVYDLNNGSGMGFTPLEYFRAPIIGSGAIEPEFRVKNNFKKENTFDKWNKIEEDYSNYNDDPTLLFKKHGGFIDDEYNMSTIMRPDDLVLDPNVIGKRLDYYSPGEYLTPSDNEDPVYHAFKVIIDVDNSPLLNGKVDEFIERFGNDNSELRSRMPILKEFRKELSRYFEFSASLNPDLVQGEPIFDTPSDIKRYYYLVKISGLDKLNESNTAGKNAPFVNYQTDLITFTLREDVSMNMGTLYSLYKSLYWSRRNGKSLIPENLLRFDCKIIISEVRNLVSIKRSLTSPLDALGVARSESSLVNNLDVLRSNLSRYVYDIYECQFFFDKPPHDASIDLSSAPKEYPTYDINLSYKFSNMTFERFNFSSDEYRRISQDIDPQNLPDWISFRDDFVSRELKTVKSGIENETNRNDLLNELDSLNEQARQNIPSPPGFGEQLLSELRSFGLNTVQSAINSRFALINQTLDNLRNQFGIGRMTPPTNVYFGNQLPGILGRFFDVRNSLMNFGGSSLVDMIGVNNDPIQFSDFSNVRFPGYSPAGDTSETILDGVDISALRFVNGAAGNTSETIFSQLDGASPKPISQDPMNLQFPNWAQRLPAPFTTNTPIVYDDFSDVRFPGFSPAGNTSETIFAQENPKPILQDPMYFQFPNWAQRFPAPFTTGVPSPQVQQSIIQNSMNIQWQTPDINQIGFPDWAQKYPPPISQ